MVKLEDAVIARFEHGKDRFEILVDPDLALKIKRGHPVNMDDLLATDTVYLDARKGEEQSEATTMAVFKTMDIREIALRIIRDGVVHLTTEQRRQLREEKHKAIVDFISQNATNPQTNTPHPPARIENAMKEAHVVIDEYKEVSTQVNEIIPKLRALIPISMEKIRVALKADPQYVSAALTVLKKFDVKKQDWQNDGSLIAIVEIPGGMRQELFDKLNNVSHGEISTKVLEKDD